VVIVVLDATGFRHLGCYASPIATPNLDRLTARGLSYNNMHTAIPFENGFLSEMLLPHGYNTYMVGKYH
jgi:arylsulfatase A-like enzyme